MKIEETKEAFTGFESPVRSADLLEVARNENTENQRTILLTEAQRGLWMLSTMNLDALRAYNLSLTLRLCGPYDHAKMLRALQGLIDRHEALRTQMSVEGETQIIAAQAVINVPMINLSHLAESEREAEACKILGEAAAQPFNTKSRVLFRAIVIKIREEQHFLMLTLHHIIGSVPSYRILVEQLCALYTSWADFSAPMQLSEFVRIQLEQIPIK